VLSDCEKPTYSDRNGNDYDFAPIAFSKTEIHRAERHDEDDARCFDAAQPLGG
jgi:hypothetical protein